MADPGDVPATNTTCPLLPQIKEAIRVAKRLHRRPSLDCLWLMLRHHVDHIQTVRSQLETAVHHGLLRVVHMKGVPCYSDPDSLKSRRTFTVSNVKNFRRAVSTGVKEMGDPEGATADSIIQYIVTTFEVELATFPEMLQPILAELTREGLLTELTPGRYQYSDLKKSSYGVLRRKNVKTVNDPHAIGSPKCVTAVHPPSDDSSIIKRFKRQRQRPAFLRLGETSSSEPETREACPAGQQKRGHPWKHNKSSTVLAAATSNVQSPKNTVTTRRIFKRIQKNYECSPCGFTTRGKTLLLKHVQNPAHAKKVQGKMVQCDVCCFRSRNAEKMTEHLQRHGCHEDKSIPSCLRSSAVLEVDPSI
ncbi:uncharacterized protein LOC129596509 [Paramacrobiotus metropolitanus]|uniref:uncharacterized protein LOC129596509 n=1 Tax=Paramacrobiotus metropolitanus TaxID=2943436 RepID=UPI002445C3AB|nr:uncharacterized protein LOC129596509 [Paramacrobiotus metropolitanus]